MEGFNGPDYDRYLGDGVWASLDRGLVVLELRGGGEALPERIALESEVLAKFDMWRSDLLASHRRQLRTMDQKIDHGCVGVNCAECD